MLVARIKTGNKDNKTKDNFHPLIIAISKKVIKEIILSEFNYQLRTQQLPLISPE